MNNSNKKIKLKTTGRMVVAVVAYLLPTAVVFAVALFYGVPFYFLALIPVLICLAVYSGYLLCCSYFGEPLKKVRETSNGLIEDCQAFQTYEVVTGSIEHKCFFGKNTAANDLGVIYDSLEYLRAFLQETKRERELYEANRKDIIAGIAHDFGTPLSAISGCAEALLDGVLSTESQKKMYLKTIHSKANALIQMADDFFLYSCLDLDVFPFHFTEVKADHLFAPIIEEMEISMQQDDIDFYILRRGFSDEKIFINIDPLQIKRVFQNLTSNCIKYMKRGGSYRKQARFCLDYLPDKRLRATLESNGIPVSHEDCVRIFTPYFRSDGAKTAAVNGTGIGLTICKQIMGAHKGTVTARQSVLGGLAVEVTFSSCNSRRGEAANPS